MRAHCLAQGQILSLRAGSGRTTASRPLAAPRAARVSSQAVTAVRVVARDSGRDGGAGVLDRPDTNIASPGRESEFDLDPKKQNQVKKPPLYRVLLHNDNTNRREYVVKVLLKVVDGLTVDLAVNIMNEAHSEGLALVVVTSQEEAECYCEALRNNGLVSTIEPESGGKGGDST